MEAQKSQAKNGPEKQAAVQPPVAQAQPAQALEKVEAKAPLTVRDLLEKAKPKLAEVLPQGFSVDRLVRVTIACVMRTPALQKCTQASLLNCVMQAAELGLEPTGGVAGEAYLVPFNDRKKGITEATLIVGYRGLIKLMRRSGELASVEAHVVHANDRFKCKFGTETVLDHEPEWSDDRGPMKAVYAVLRYKDGSSQVEVLTKADVMGIKAKSRAATSGPWADPQAEPEMWKKSAVRRVAKYGPLSAEAAQALDREDEFEKRVGDDDVTPAPTGTAGLAAIVKAKQQTVEAEHADETPHDPATGEVQEPQQAAGEEEPPEGPTEAIDPTAPAPAAEAAKK
jgi:recombination protein RecT